MNTNVDEKVKNNMFAATQLGMYADIKAVEREYKSLVKWTVIGSGITASSLTFIVMTLLNVLK